jgi:hypothetical protein
MEIDNAIRAFVERRGKRRTGEAGRAEVDGTDGAAPGFSRFCRGVSVTTRSASCLPVLRDEHSAEGDAMPALHVGRAGEQLGSRVST